jgi:hypothetical protein
VITQSTSPPLPPSLAQLALINAPFIIGVLLLTEPKARHYFVRLAVALTTFLGVLFWDTAAVMSITHGILGGVSGALLV